MTFIYPLWVKPYPPTLITPDPIEGGFFTSWVAPVEDGNLLDGLVVMVGTALCLIFQAHLPPPLTLWTPNIIHGSTTWFQISAV